MLWFLTLLVVFATSITLYVKNDTARQFMQQSLGVILTKADEFLHSDWSKGTFGQSVKGYLNAVNPWYDLKEDEEIKQLPDNIRNVLLGGTSHDEKSEVDSETTKQIEEEKEQSKDYLDPLRRIGLERKESVRKLVGRFESELDLRSPQDKRSSYTGKKHPTVETTKTHSGPADVKTTPTNVKKKAPDVPPTKPVKRVKEAVPLEEQKAFRNLVKSFLEEDEDYVLHLGRLIPDCYQKPINQFRKKQDSDKIDERSYELLEILFNKLAKQLASDPAHMKLFTLKRSIMFDKPLSHNANALKLMSEMVMQFVKDTLCKKYIPYVGEYIGIRPKIQLLFNDDKALKKYIREQLDVEAEKVQKQDKNLLKTLLLEDMIAEPCKRLTVYLTTFRDEWYPYFKEAQLSTKIEKSKDEQETINQAVTLLENAYSKLEREMKNHFLQLEKAFQMNKIYEIQRKIGLDSLATETADILLSNSALLMKSKSESLTTTERISSIPNFIYESVDDSEHMYPLGKNGKRKTNFAFEGYLLENMLILSGLDVWEGKRKNKVYYLKGCSVEGAGEKELRLVISGHTKRFECQTARARQRWLSCLQSVCETGFFSTETAKKLAQHIRQHSGVEDAPQDYYAVPLDELYKKPELWACFDNNDYNILYEKSDNQTNTKRPIRAASLEKLVQMLTSPERFDQSFLFSFMLTYQSFTTSEELIQILTNRYNIPPPKDKQSFISFKENILFPVRIRVCQVLKHWIQHHSYIFRGDPRVRNKLSLFIEQHVAKTKLFSLADELRDDLEKFAKKRDTFTEQQLRMLSQKVNDLQLGNSKSTKTQSIDAPKPRMPRSIKSITSRGRSRSIVFSILDWSSVEIARQLTLIEFAIYESIQVKECLNQAWSKNMAPNLKAMIDRTNLIVLFVGYEILKQESSTARIHAIQKWIKVGRECRKLNNYNACREIVGGLKQVAVSRLSKTWDKVDAKLKKEFEELSALVSQNKNYKSMRSALSSSAPPCIPYVGVYLRDLTFIDEGNKDLVPNTNQKPSSQVDLANAPYKPELVNFFKRQKIGVVIRDLQQYQSTPYIFVCVPELANKLQNIVSVPEDKLIEMSLTAEPE